LVIKQELEKQKFNDAIVAVADNEIIESVRGNILVARMDNVYPYLDECGVEGVMRNQICDYFA